MHVPAEEMKKDLDELIVREHSPFAILNDDVHVLVVHKVVNSIWCQWTSSLPNP